MKTKDQQYFLIIDLEATCNDEPPLPSQDMETIEVGAVLVDLQKNEEVATFRTMVSPVKMHNVTPFCAQLTGITKDDVKHAPDFEEVIWALDNWLAGFTDQRVFWGSWGRYDANQIERDSKRHKVTSVALGTHTNLKEMFKKQKGGDRKQVGLSRALKICGLEFEGRKHSALWDAKNVARLVYDSHLTINETEIIKYSKKNNQHQKTLET